jgi:serine/threonine-protein kinase
MRLGAYELCERLATGGMAEVFLGRRAGPAGFEKLVAVKRILPHLVDSPAFVQMFMDEARIAALLDHPHITHVYDFGASHGLYYIAMEYVPGKDLAAIGARARRRRHAISPLVVATIAIASCEGLHHAHEMCGPDGRPLGIVHRDVSPSNILVSYDGAVKLADFGIAQAEHRSGAAGAGVPKGKRAYVAPEQAAGGTVDRRADVWALGVCLWELLAGRRPFAGRTIGKVLRAIARGAMPPLVRVRPDAPPALCSILERALAPEPEGRWPTAQAMQLALEDYLTAERMTPSKLAVASCLRDLFGEPRRVLTPDIREPTTLLKPV